MMCGRDEEPRPSVRAYYKIIYDLCMLQGYEHMMLIIKNKHQENQRRPLKMRNNGMCTSDQK
jgi:hypothetical protein